MNTEKVPKPSDVDADPAQAWGRLRLDKKRTKRALSESTGALVRACWHERVLWQHGRSRHEPGEIRQRAALEGKAGPDGKSDNSSHFDRCRDWDISVLNGGRINRGHGC